MEITKDRLREIIKEEYRRVNEAPLPGERMPVGLAPRARSQAVRPIPPSDDVADEPVFTGVDSDEADSQVAVDIARDALILVGEFLQDARPLAQVRPVVQELLDNISGLESQKGLPEEEQTLYNQRAAEALGNYLARLDRSYR